MTMTLDDLEAEALQLPAHLRARLAETLISSLDEEAELEQVWADEAERRYRELVADAVSSTPAAEVFAKARSRLG